MLYGFAEMTTVEIAALSAFAALATIGFGIYKYLDVRKRELEWKRMEFTFDQAKYLDDDPEIHRAVMILLELDDEFAIKDIFGTDGFYREEASKQCIRGFEKLFNLLDRIAYAYERNIITKAELNNFGMYLHEIISNGRVTKYCQLNGYPDVVKAAQDVE